MPTAEAFRILKLNLSSTLRRGMKVIMFTAGEEPNVSPAFFAAGASAFISKLSSVELLSTIKRLCIDRD